MHQIMERVRFVSGPILHLKSNIHLLEIVVEAQKLAAAAADAHNKATAAPDNPGRNRRFDPIRDL